MRSFWKQKRNFEDTSVVMTSSPPRFNQLLRIQFRGRIGCFCSTPANQTNRSIVPQRKVRLGSGGRRLAALQVGGAGGVVAGLEPPQARGRQRPPPPGGGGCATRQQKHCGGDGLPEGERFSSCWSVSGKFTDLPSPPPCLGNCPLRGRPVPGPTTSCCDRLPGKD